MPVLNWNDRYSIGILQLDMHHQHLFFLMRKTYGNFINKAHHQDLDLLFDEIIDCATYHIAAEKQYMLESNFPGINKQKKDHDLFFLRIVEMSKSYRRGERHLLIEMLSFLHNWLSTHIIHSDAEFGLFVAKNKTGKFKNLKLMKAVSIADAI